MIGGACYRQHMLDKRVQYMRAGQYRLQSDPSGSVFGFKRSRDVECRLLSKKQWQVMYDDSSHVHHDVDWAMCWQHSWLTGDKLSPAEAAQALKPSQLLQKSMYHLKTYIS